MDNKSFIFVILYGLINIGFSRHMVPIGGIFDSNGNETEEIFKGAIRYTNEKLNYNYYLMDVTSVIEPGQESMLSTKLCSILDQRIFALFGPAMEISAFHARHICDQKEMPYIETRWESEPNLSAINIYPSLDSLSKMLLDVINASSWDTFTILYESPMWLAGISPLLELYEPNEHRVSIRQLFGDDLENNTSREVLQKVKKTEQRNILLECTTENLIKILDQMLQVSLLSEERHLIITNLDLLTFDLEKYRYTGANITGFRIVQKDMVKDVLEHSRNKFGSTLETELELFESLKIQTALIYDGVQLFARAINDLNPTQEFAETLDCNNNNSVWRNGLTVANYLKSTRFNGLTGEVRFDQQGLRSFIDLTVFELQPYGEEPVAKWNTDDGLIITRKIVPYDPLKDGPISEKTFRVLLTMVDPFCMLKDNSSALTGNDQYEGFSVDLLDALAEILKFKYEITTAPKNYGKIANNYTEAWDGVVGMILNKTADLVIGDITITAERVHVMDFTSSFMSLGIALLYRKPTKSPPSTFSFMDPFSTEVWICLGLSYLAVSLCYFILGRISAYEWDNPYPCIEEPTELDNQFTITNSMWFAIGALLQQGSEMAPRSPSARIASSVWWFFTLIMVSSYTANLAAFLVNEKPDEVITSVYDLVDCIDGPDHCPIKEFGCKQGGSTYNFFVNSDDAKFRRIGEYLKKHEKNLPTENKDGIEKTFKKYEKNDSNYAFLVESAIIEYEIERKCNLTQIGELLDDKNYGIGMRQNYTYYNDLSEAVLGLQEKGNLAELKNKWWKDKDGGGICEVTETDSAVALSLQNVIGIFYTLIIGGGISVLFAIADVLLETRKRCKIQKEKETEEAKPLILRNTIGIFLVLLFGGIIATVWGIIELILLVYRRSLEYKLPFRHELWKEIVFLVTSTGHTKPVVRRKTPSSSASPYSGSSYRSNKSRYSPMAHDNRNSSVHHYK